MTPELIEAMQRFEEIFPMKCRVVSTEAEFETVVTEMKAKGLRLAAVSNAGLVHGKQRLTFLPHDAFTDAAPST